MQHADPATRGQIFGYLNRDKQIEIIESGDRAEIGQLIAELPADDRVDILKAVPAAVVDELLPYVPALDRRDILRLRSYPEGTAGAMMTSQYARLPEGLTVKQALDEVAKQAEELETIYYVYIVDGDDHLRGLVSARHLVSALGKPNLLIDELMDRELVTVDVMDDQEQVAQKVARFDLHAIPVVDEEHHMLGIITHDDVMDVIREEATEDVHMAGAVAPGVDNYLETEFRHGLAKADRLVVVLVRGGAVHLHRDGPFRSDRRRLSRSAYFIPLCISTGDSEAQRRSGDEFSRFFTGLGYVVGWDGRWGTPERWYEDRQDGAIVCQVQATVPLAEFLADLPHLVEGKPGVGPTDDRCACEDAAKLRALWDSCARRLRGSWE